MVRRVALVIDRGTMPPRFLEQGGAMLSRVSQVVGVLAEPDEGKLEETMKEMAAALVLDCPASPVELFKSQLVFFLEIPFVFVQRFGKGCLFFVAGEWSAVFGHQVPRQEDKLEFILVGQRVLHGFVEIFAVASEAVGG